MTQKKFTDYDMRNDFSLPVYVGYELVEVEGIKGIDPKKEICWATSS